MTPFFSTPLARHPDHMVHIRVNDYAVLFTPATAASAINPNELFEKHAELIQERQPPNKTINATKTLTVYLVLSEKCNLQCVYCDVLGSADHRQNQALMSWEIAEVAINSLKQRLYTEPKLKAQIVFFGGEPLLNWSLLVKICETIETSNCNEQIEKMLVTNGILLDEVKAAFLKKHQVYVVVSLDGSQEVNDRMRRYYNGKGCFEETAKGLQTLRQVMPNQYGISCTLGSHNASTLSEEIVCLQEKFEPCCIGINVYHYQQDGACPIKIDDDTLCDSLLKAFRVARQKGIAIYQFANIIKSFINRTRNRDYCPACGNKLLFSPRGRVGRCETLMNHERFSIPLKEFTKQAMPAHLDWSKYTPEHESECLNCIARWICPGTCTYDQFISTGALHGVEHRRCNFHRKLLIELFDLLLDAAIKEEMLDGIFIPTSCHFKSVLGNSPITFPPHTIFITGVGPMTSEKNKVK